MFPLLTLDESTLFYWTLSNESHEKQKHMSAINKWALAVPAKKPTSQRAPTTAPSLTFGSSGRTYAPSVLSDNVKIITHQSSDVAKARVKAEPQAVPALSLHNNGGLSDNDEIKGEEWVAAHNSPPKGKKRLDSEVFFFS